MNTEREKMLAGELYNALDPELVQERDRARDLCKTLNAKFLIQPIVVRLKKQRLRDLSGSKTLSRWTACRDTSPECSVLRKTSIIARRCGTPMGRD
jgi:hypothetical protein